MKLQDLFFPLLTALFVSSFLFFLSCASTDTVREDTDDPVDVSTEGTPKEEGDKLESLANGTNKSEEEQRLQEAKSGLEPGNDLSNTGTAGNSEILATLGGESTATNLVPTPPAGEPGPPAAENLDELKAIMGGNPTEPVESAIPKKTRKSTRIARTRSESLPRISDKAIQKGGALLNRFYFVRRGDTPARVARLLYGTSQRTDELIGWNGGQKTWKAGKLIYYASATELQDNSMRSFYQERSVPPSEYRVKRRDWLSKISQVKLGDARSWKEVAIVSGIDKPNRIEIGQRLILYPADLSAYTVDKIATTTHQADNREQNGGGGKESTPPDGPSKDESMNQPQTSAKSSGIIEPIPAEEPEAKVVPPVAVSKPDETGKKRGGGLDFAKLLQQNLVFGLFALVALPLLILLVFINKRKNAKRQEEMNDDFLATPSNKKVKRK